VKSSGREGREWSRGEGRKAKIKKWGSFFSSIFGTNKRNLTLVGPGAKVLRLH
jgi:hypothetical protein